MRLSFFALVRRFLGLLVGPVEETPRVEVYSKRWEERPFPGDGI
jgi:hypothetical protein